MKTRKRIFSNAVSVILALVLSLGIMSCLAGCGGIKLTVSAEKTVLSRGQSTAIDVELTGTDDLTVTYTSANPEILTVSEAGIVRAVGTVTENTAVDVTVTPAADEKKAQTITFTVTPPKAAITVSVTADKKELRKGDTAQLTVTVTGAEEGGYNLKSSDESLLTVTSAGVVTMTGDVGASTPVSVTATSLEDQTVRGAFTFTLRPPVNDTSVENLTSEMIAEIGNPSITVTGTVVDHYENINRPMNNSDNVYEMRVEMSEEAWKGEWWAQGNEENVISDMYKKGSGTVINANGLSGSPVNKVYIDKNNTPTGKQIKDAFGVPVLWETQSLWNRLGDLQIRKFSRDLDAEELRTDGAEVYAYDINYEDMSPSGDLWLMAYLTVSLTPMLESGDDSFMYFYLVVKDGKIIEVRARTLMVYDTTDPADANELSYTDVTLTLSKIGETTVSDPKVYEADESTEILRSALAKMKAAESYTWAATDVTTNQPDTDSGEYELNTPAKIGGGVKEAVARKGISNGTDSQGTVGARGWITDVDVLVETTSMYSSTMDGKPYKKEYTGYHTTAAGASATEKYYEQFEYDSYVENADGTKGALKGVKRIYGEIGDILPAWDFAPEVFESVGYSGNNHTFVLRDSSISGELAPEVSMYRYASDASASTSTTFTITVSPSGDIISTRYPYSIVGGTYMGYVTTRYTDVNKTSIIDGAFSDYVERVIPNEWNKITINYRPGHSTLVPDNHLDGETVVKAIFGKDSVNDVPAPGLFINVFGDNMSRTVSHDWRNKGTDEAPSYIDFVSFNISTDDYDEYYKPRDYEGLMESLGAELAKVGYVRDEVNTDMKNESNRYVSFVNNTTGLMVVVQNINTKFFYVYIYKAGDWTLSK